MTGVLDAEVILGREEKQGQRMFQQRLHTARTLVFGAEDFCGNLQLFQIGKGHKQTAVKPVDGKLPEITAMIHHRKKVFETFPRDIVVRVIIGVFAVVDQNIAQQVSGKIQRFSHILTEEQEKTPIQKPLGQAYQAATGALKVRIVCQYGRVEVFAINPVFKVEILFKRGFMDELVF